MSIVGNIDVSPDRDAVEFRPSRLLIRWSSEFDWRAASLMMVGMGFGVAVEKKLR